MSSCTLITGAAGALGSSLSRKLAASGATTVLLDVNRRGLERLYDKIVQEGGTEPVLYPADLTGITPDDVQQLLEQLGAEFSGMDALIHCAARFEGLTPLENTQPQEWLAHMQVNLNAAWLLSSACLNMIRAGKGKLVFLLDDLQKVSGGLWGPYGVSKNALAALAGQFQAETASTDVSVFAVNPGAFSSDLRAQAYLAENPASQASPDAIAQKLLDVMSQGDATSGVIALQDS